MKEYDVIVCGGGPAGVCGAIASARAGAKTLLIEKKGCLGGIWTSGLLSWFLDIKEKSGIICEIMEELTKRGEGRRREYGPCFSANPEAVKLLLEEMCLNSGVEILLDTVVSDSFVENGEIKCIETVSKSGKETFEAKYFIDATGDGDLSYLSGCSYEIGNKDSKTQPMSLCALVTGIGGKEFDEYDNFINPFGCKAKKLEDMEKAGINPSYKSPFFTRLHENSPIFMAMLNHEYDVLPTSNRDITKATINARKEINEIINKLRSYGGVWKNLTLVATADSIGIREGRRIKGEYTLTHQDVLEGKKFDDAMCRVHFPMDVHALNNKVDEDEAKKGRGKALPYDVPLRCAKTKDIKNLYTAGRCISGDFYAHSSYRVTGTASVIGEYVGNYVATHLK
ncbi:MAG: FAD-dependent oxidoreductase [Clostridia bacterium]|nr:FAD-dependent oxidoreductase [Clostridia bacterium]